ncbi:protein kinase domain-containing protein [Pseudovibrio sp. Alg231-02]|uniref:protein kinase domain-containing protein n=1 Tax=Pseudovibrio sp. Alg231-02 TaxID=1922223 RepID=UPI00131F4323|nr:serine/threonine-protein kinase [Pseudovibrio sp. Alg231-02]
MKDRPLPSPSIVSQPISPILHTPVEAEAAAQNESVKLYTSDKGSSLGVETQEQFLSFKGNREQQLEQLRKELPQETLKSPLLNGTAALKAVPETLPKSYDWVGEPVVGDAPDLSTLKPNITEKFAEGESHISTYTTADGHNLVGKIERTVAAGHLKAELSAYKTIYENAGEHPNLGKVYGMASVPYGSLVKEALVMDEVVGDRGSVTMRKLNLAWKAGDISSAQYWGSVQYIGQKLLDVTGHISKAGLVHNDIKPDNYVVSAETGEPVIIDLGLHSKAGETAKGFTEDYKAPEVHPRHPQTSEKSDVFSVGATLLSGVEQGLRDQNHMPNAGLWHSTKISRDDEGNAVKIPGLAAVETDYSRFMDGLQNSVNQRPDAAEAGSLSFIQDSLIEESEARSVLKDVVSNPKYDDRGARSERQVTEKDIRNSFGDVRNVLVQRAKNESQGDAAFAIIELGKQCKTVIRAEKQGNADSSVLGRLRELVSKTYHTLSQFSAHHNTSARKSEAYEVSRILSHEVSEFKQFDPQLMTEPKLKNLHELELLETRLSAVLDLTIPAGKQSTMPPDDVLVSLYYLTGKQIEVRDAISQLKESQGKIEAYQQAHSEQDISWLPVAEDALQTFEATHPRVVSSWGHEAELHAKVNSENAQKAWEKVEHLQPELERLSEDLKSVLSLLGPGPYPTDRLGALREDYTQKLGTVDTLLRLEREWVI